ncbi:MAG TPA: hypothetical protein VN768_05910 [Acidimicrobiales bacterium]|nr:hypothetical protein [Acidimicrobiales bacterium]
MTESPTAYAPPTTGVGVHVAAAAPGDVVGAGSGVVVAVDAGRDLGIEVVDDVVVGAAAVVVVGCVAVVEVAGARAFRPDGVFGWVRPVACALSGPSHTAPSTATAATPRIVTTATTRRTPRRAGLARREREWAALCRWPGGVGESMAQEVPA